MTTDEICIDHFEVQSDGTARFDIALPLVIISGWTLRKNSNDDWVLFPPRTQQRGSIVLASHVYSAVRAEAIKMMVLEISSHGA